MSPGIAAGIRAQMIPLVTVGRRSPKLRMTAGIGAQMILQATTVNSPTPGVSVRPISVKLRIAAGIGASPGPSGDQYIPTPGPDTSPRPWDLENSHEAVWRDRRHVVGCRSGPLAVPPASSPSIPPVRDRSLTRDPAPRGVSQNIKAPRGRIWERDVFEDHQRP